MTSRWSSDEREGHILEAERGDTAAQMWLGWAYWEGKFVEIDLKKSEIWLKRAASSGHGEAQYRLALFYKHVTHEHSKIPDLLRSAIKNGCNAAAYELGYMYYNGFMLPQDRSEATSLWRHAINSGHILSEIPLIRAEFRETPALKKPFVWLKLIKITSTVVRRFWKNPNDPSILGAPV